MSKSTTLPSSTGSGASVSAGHPTRQFARTAELGFTPVCSVSTSHSMNVTFSEFAVGELFVTGPGCRLFAKMGDEQARDVITGEQHYIPDVRLGRTPLPEDYVRAANRLKDHKLFHLG